MAVSVPLTLVFPESTSDRKFSPPIIIFAKVSAVFINVRFYTPHTYMTAHISFTLYYTYMVEN